MILQKAHIPHIVISFTYSVQAVNIVLYYPSLRHIKSWDYQMEDQKNTSLAK